MKLTLVTIAVIIIVSRGLWKGNASENRDTGSIFADGLTNDYSLDADAILFRRGRLNTNLHQDLDSAGSDSAPSRSGESVQGDTQTRVRIVQLRDRIRPSWVKALKDLGCRVIGYLPNNAYLIAGNSAAIARVTGLDGGSSADDQHPIKWMGSFLPAWKIDPVLDQPATDSGGGTWIDVEIELYNTPELIQAIDKI